MCDLLFRCFQKYKHCANVLSLQIIDSLQIHCVNLKNSSEHDSWKPILGKYNKYLLVTKLTPVLKKYEMSARNMNKSFMDFTTLQFAHYIFDKMIHKDDLDITLHGSLNNDTNDNQPVPEFHNETLNTYKEEFGKIPGRYIELNSTFVIDKYLLDAKFNLSVTDTINSIDFDILFDMCNTDYNNNQSP